MATKDISDAQVCRAYHLWIEEGRNRWPYEYLMEWTGEPLKVCERAMERAVDRDLVEYGVTMRSGWLTSKGRELLENTVPDAGVGRDE